MYFVNYNDIVWKIFWRDHVWLKSNRIVNMEIYLCFRTFNSKDENENTISKHNTSSIWIVTETSTTDPILAQRKYKSNISAHRRLTLGLLHPIIWLHHSTSWIKIIIKGITNKIIVYTFFFNRYFIVFLLPQCVVAVGITWQLRHVVRLCLSQWIVSVFITVTTRISWCGCFTMNATRSQYFRSLSVIYVLQSFWNRADTFRAFTRDSE